MMGRRKRKHTYILELTQAVYETKWLAQDLIQIFN